MPDPITDCPICGSKGVFDKYIDRVRTARFSCSNPECEHIWVTGPFVKDGQQPYQDE
jgi:hypothetical protein